MRYKLNFDRLVNQLVPHFLSGRKYILFLQSLVFPLRSTNEYFTGFAHEKLIEARMTSQIMYFEWYLNRKFSRYLTDPDEPIYIRQSSTIGVDIYHEKAQHAKPYTLWGEKEIVSTVNPAEKPREFYFLTEEKAVNKVSFMVCVPEICIAKKEFVYMLSYEVNRYKLAGMTYLIKIDSKEITPNKK